MPLIAKFKKGAALGATIARAYVSGAAAARPVYLDVGSRGGLPPRWHWAYRAGLIAPSFVEADRDEAARLAKRYPGARVLGDALGAVDGEQAVLRLTREPGRSSLLEPDRAALAPYDPAPWEVIERRGVVLRRFDRAWQPGWPAPDFLKLDVQGYELRVLEGMGEILAHVSCLEIEVSLTAFYAGQPTLGTVADFLHNAGFDLVKLAAIGLYGDRAMLEFNAFWVRRAQHADASVRLWKAINDVGDRRRVGTWGY